MLCIALGRGNCSLVSFDAGRAVDLRRARRETDVGIIAKLLACIIATEDCRVIRRLGPLLATLDHNIFQK